MKVYNRYKFKEAFIHGVPSDDVVLLSSNDRFAIFYPVSALEGMYDKFDSMTDEEVLKLANETYMLVLPIDDFNEWYYKADAD